MKKVIIIRYGEIHLKGKNRGFFEDLLKNNIKNAVVDFGATVSRIPGRYLVDNFADRDEERLVSAIGKVAGIFSYSVATEVASDYDEIKAEAIRQVQDKEGSFKVFVNRGDKHFPLNSMELAREIGGDILDANSDFNPKHKLNIDVRENGKTYIFSEVIYGMGGMPVGSSGKGMLLLSGGIDSPVAGYMMAKRGTKLVAVHYHSYPYTSALAREKVEKLAELLLPYNGGNLTIYMVNMAKYQETIHANCNDSYMITLLRRGMFRIAERLCKDHDADMLITGENLGQVASQTIESMTVVENVLNSTPVLRPLVAFDKTDIITVAKKIGTFETSIQPYEDCCTVFLPDNPVTKPKLSSVEREEQKFDWQGLLNDAYNSIEVVRF
jgi:thiamine biosynthesis protein ThiI